MIAFREGNARAAPLLPGDGDSNAATGPGSVRVRARKYCGSRLVTSVMPIDPAAAADGDSVATQVALVADQPLARRRIHAALEVAERGCVVDVPSVDELLGHPLMDAVHVVVLHLAVRAGQVLDEVKRVRSRRASVAIVGFWPPGERREDRRALRAGVDGLLDEGQIEVALVPTIEAVRSGLVCLPRRAQRKPQVDLSTREKQVLCMLIMGLTNAEIGRRLYLAESTVKSHLSSAYMKLGVRSRKDAAALILDPDEGLGTGILAISAP